MKESFYKGKGPVCSFELSASGSFRLGPSKFLDMTYIQNTGLATSFSTRLVVYTAIGIEQLIILWYALTNHSSPPLD